MALKYFYYVQHCKFCFFFHTFQATLNLFTSKIFLYKPKSPSRMLVVSLWIVCIWTGLENSFLLQKKKLGSDTGDLIHKITKSVLHLCFAVHHVMAKTMQNGNSSTFKSHMAFESKENYKISTFESDLITECGARCSNEPSCRYFQYYENCNCTIWAK